MTSTHTLYRRIALLGFLCIAFAAHAQMYRWTDKEGRVHYTDTPPPATAVKTEEKNLRGNIATGGDLPFATQEAMKKYPVRLYTAEKCSGCPDARALLQKRGIPYSEIKVIDGASQADLKRATNDTVVPALVVGTDFRVGFESDTWNGALNTAGYPSSTPRPVSQPPEQQKPAESTAPHGPYTPR